MFDEIGFKICHILYNAYKNPKFDFFHFSFCAMYHKEWQLISSHILKFCRVNTQWDKILKKSTIYGSRLQLGQYWGDKIPRERGRLKKLFSTIKRYREKKNCFFYPMSYWGLKIFDEDRQTILEFLLINYFPG